MSHPTDAGRRLHLQRRHCSRRAAGALLAALVAFSAGAAPREEFPLEDLLQIVVTRRTILAVDAEGGGDTPERLERGEKVLWTHSRGRVGVALTDRRVLAAGTGSAAWQSTRYLRGESRPHKAELGDRVALVVTDRRLLGFNGGSGNLVEESIGPREQVLQTRVSANLAVAVTSRRALGLSPFAGGFFQTPLRLSEQIESLVVSSGVATLTTSQRLLVFRGRTGAWSERTLSIR